MLLRLRVSALHKRFGDKMIGVKKKVKGRRGAKSDFHPRPCAPVTLLCGRLSANYFFSILLIEEMASHFFPSFSVTVPLTSTISATNGISFSFLLAA